MLKRISTFISIAAVILCSITYVLGFDISSYFVDDYEAKCEVSEWWYSGDILSKGNPWVWCMCWSSGIPGDEDCNGGPPER